MILKLGVRVFLFAKIEITFLSDSIFLLLMFRESIFNVSYSPIPTSEQKKRGILPISLCYFVESNIRLRSARKYSI